MSDYNDYYEEKLKAMRKPVLLVRYNEESGISSDPNEKMLEFRVSVVYIDPDEGTPNNYRDYDRNETKYNLDFDDMLIRGVGFSGRNYVDKWGMGDYSVTYHNVYALDLREAESKVKTLRNIYRKLDKYRQEYGIAESFDSYLMRVAKAIGSKVILVMGRKTSHKWGYAGYEYFEYSIKDAEIALSKAIACYKDGFGTRS
jgi:hypothetical protein